MILQTVLDSLDTTLNQHTTGTVIVALAKAIYDTRYDVDEVEVNGLASVITQMCSGYKDMPTAALISAVFNAILNEIQDKQENKNEPIHNR